MELNTTIKDTNKIEELLFKKMVISEKADPEDESMKITDLSDYCLAQIFKYLNLYDLLNVAESNTILQYAAGVVFQQDYGAKIVRIKNITKMNCLAYEKLEFCIGDYIIDPIKFQSFLLNFGDVISAIEICYSDYKGQNSYQQTFKKIFDVISNHSLETLERLQFMYFPRGWLNKFSKPLLSVKTVNFIECHLDDKASLLTRVFPKLHNLSIVCHGSTQHNQIIAHFPDLKALELVTYVKRNESLAEFETFLNINPQLPVLQLKIYGTSNEWSLVKFVADNSEFERFDLCYHEFSQHERVHFKKLKHVRVWSANVTTGFPFIFDQLEILHISQNKIDQVDEIITRNRKLNEIVLSSDNLCSIIKSSKELRRLPKVTFYFARMQRGSNFDDLVEFLNKKSSAQKIALCFQGSAGTLRNDLEVAIKKSRWNMSSNFSALFLQR